MRGQFFGFGIATLRCGGAFGAGAAPSFNPDHLHPPSHCANGAGSLAAEAGAVDLLSPDLPFRGHCALGWGSIIAFPGNSWPRSTRSTHEASTTTSSPIATSGSGRQRQSWPSALRQHRRAYIATPALLSQFDQVLQLRGQSQSYSEHITMQLERHWFDRAELKVAWTWSRVRDVQTTANPSRGELE